MRKFFTARWKNFVSSRLIHRTLKRGLRHLFERAAERKLRKRGYLPLLQYRPARAFAPSFVDIWFLYRTVRARKPHCVLEFGSGYSTILIAQALWENQRESPTSGGRVVAIEADFHWAKANRESLPPHLQALCTIVHCPLEETRYGDETVFRHAHLPRLAPDFIYVDGPAFPPGVRQVVIDILDSEPNFQPGFYMVVDGRWETVAFFRKHLRRHYRFRPSWLLGRSTFELIP